MPAEFEYSLLRDSEIRPFPIALGRVLAYAKENDPRCKALTRLYLGLSDVERGQCQVEMVKFLPFVG